jgi:hypothetical protein
MVYCSALPAWRVNGLSLIPLTAAGGSFKSDLQRSGTNPEEWSAAFRE